METVTYVFSEDKKTLLGAYFNDLNKMSERFKFSKTSIQSHIKSGKPLKTGEYILKGPEAVKLVLSLEHVQEITNQKTIKITQNPLKNLIYEK